MDTKATKYCSNPACDCHRTMIEFFRTNESIPRLKSNRDYPVASHIPVLPPSNFTTQWGAKRRVYPCRDPMRKNGAKVGKQTDPCPMSLVQHPRDWDDDTSIPTDRDPALYKQNKRKTIKSIKMI